METRTNHLFYTLLTPAEFKTRLAAAPVAYLPLGTLEWHGPHLPLGADGLQSQGFFVHLAEQVGGIILPMLFLDPDLVHMEYLPQDPQEWPKAILGRDPRLYANEEVGKQIIQVQGAHMEGLLRAALAALANEIYPNGV